MKHQANATTTNNSKQQQAAWHQQQLGYRWWRGLLRDGYKPSVSLGMLYLVHILLAGFPPRYDPMTHSEDQLSVLIAIAGTPAGFNLEATTPTELDDGDDVLSAVVITMAAENSPLTS